MTTPVTFTRDGRIGLICIDQPPVNALTSAVVTGLAEAFDNFERDTTLDALVIHCGGRTFVAGGDITAFEVPGFSAEPLNRLFGRIEASRKLVVAALHGTVLGGGLELAMACHHRVASADARFGMPEVHLGLLPGSLGTQRLPRLVGPAMALDLISSGRMIGAQPALAAGLLDALSESAPRDAGIAAANALLAAGRAPRRASQLPVTTPEPGLLERAESEAAAKPNHPARSAIVRALRAAVTLPFDQGAAVEAQEFDALLQDPTSRALRHLFFAEREAAKIPSLPRDTPLRPVRRVGVIGAGTMGGGIAMNFLNAGIPTVVVEVNEMALQRGLGIIRRNYEASAAKGRLTPKQVEQRMGLLTAALSYHPLADCDLVIEAVFEDLALKTTVCARMGAIAKPGAIIATNTSTLDVDVLARATGRPADVVGMHFFSPANVMRLLEIVRGAVTAPDVLATVMKLAGQIGKVPVVSGVCYGFIGNRMAEVYMREAEFLLMEGAEPSQVDEAVEALGMAMGPCRMLDMAGVDVGARTVIESSKAGRLPPDPSYRALVQALFECGRFGQKTAQGYYRYEGRKAVGDPALTELATEIALKHGVARRAAIPQQEIVERLLYPLINEGIRILEEGIAYRPGDIDVVWVAGYGFPDFRGGPMLWADHIGLATIAERLEHYAAARGNAFGYWTPAPLLTRLINEGRPLGGWRRD